MKEPGFRPGHVPLDMVEKKVQPQYLEIAQFEEAIHA
jgi:FKBP-type peptidyl-prolyl cis-trans isomerase (trigger factor)